MALRLTRRKAWYPGFALITAATMAVAAPTDWPMFGQSVANTASATAGKSAPAITGLAPIWTFTTGGDVSARAAVVNGIVYFPDWGGNLWALNAANGSLIWGHQLSDYGLAAGTVSRTSPAVVGGVVYIGTQYNSAEPAGNTGWLLAINASTGKLMWKMQPDTSNVFPVITASPTVVQGIVYVGMTSNEEYVAADPTYPCCSVRGSVVAVNAGNGKKLWQTFMAPQGYSGANVWGSNPVVDTARKTVYVGTGNNYHPPADYVTCLHTPGSTPATCLPASDHADSIVALDMNTGAIKWATRLMNWGQFYASDGSDFWNVACVFGVYPNCPTTPDTGPDYDFGSAPNEITYQTANGAKTIIGAGQKSGIYYALDPDTGNVLWQTQVGPGSSLGGIEWGSASDGSRIYVAISNLYGIPYATGSSVSYAGSWAALNPATGAILWQTPDPNGAVDIGPMAVANGVVYAPSMGGAASTTATTMFGLDAASGNIVWSFAPGSSVNAGATVAEGMVYWGSGYGHLGSFLGTGNNKFWAFGN